MSIISNNEQQHVEKKEQNSSLQQEVVEFSQTTVDSTSCTSEPNDATPIQSNKAPKDRRNYQILEGRWAIAGSIVETGLAGGASATALAWLYMSGWTTIPFIDGLKIAAASLFIIITSFLGIRIMEQVNYFFGNPGVTQDKPYTVSGGAIVFLKRMCLAALSVLILYAIAGIFVVTTVIAFQ